MLDHLGPDDRIDAIAFFVVLLVFVFLLVLHWYSFGKATATIRYVYRCQSKHAFVTTKCRVDVTYTVDGKVYNETMWVSPEFKQRNSLVTGGKIAVYYRKGDPGGDLTTSTDGETSATDFFFYFLLSLVPAYIVRSTRF